MQAECVRTWKHLQDASYGHNGDRPKPITKSSCHHFSFCILFPTKMFCHNSSSIPEFSHYIDT